MTPEEKKLLEDAAHAAREAADTAHNALAENPEDEALQTAADEKEEQANKAQAEADAAVVDDPASPKEEEKKDDDEDIDFEKELEELGGGTPPPPPPATKSELEKAERNLYFNAERVRKLGGDPAKVVKPRETPPPEEEPDKGQFVTKDDLARRDLDTELRKISRTDAEFKVMKWHAEHSVKLSGNPAKDAENAYLIAHKGRIQRSFAELRRASFARPPAGGAGPGRKPPARPAQAPQLTAGELARMKARGFTLKSDGNLESKRYTMKYDAAKKGWVTEKKPS